jgi:hypothetical protein
MNGDSVNITCQHNETIALILLPHEMNRDRKPLPEVV